MASKELLLWAPVQLQKFIFFFFLEALLYELYRPFRVEREKKIWALVRNNFICDTNNGLLLNQITPSADTKPWTRKWLLHLLFSFFLFFSQLKFRVHSLQNQNIKFKKLLRILSAPWAIVDGKDSIWVTDYHTEIGDPVVSHWLSKILVVKLIKGKWIAIWFFFF